MLYLCTVTIKGDTNHMIKIYYVNGLFSRAENQSLKKVGLGENVIMMARNEGWPFRGEPKDMAKDAIRHINDEYGLEFALIPVISISKQSLDDQGNYFTEEVVFQAIS